MTNREKMWAWSMIGAGVVVMVLMIGIFANGGY